MEATFSIKATKLEEDLAERAKQQKEGGKKVHTLDAPEEKTVWQKYLDKKKEKRKSRKEQAKAERAARKKGDQEPQEDGAGEESKADGTTTWGDLNLLAAGDAVEDARGFNMRGSQRQAHRGQGVTGTAPLSKKKRKAGIEPEDVQGDFSVNLEDPRIEQVFSNADFEIDPTNPEFRRTEGMGAVLKKKRQRKAAARPAAAAPPDSRTSGPSATSSAAASAAPAAASSGDRERRAASGGDSLGGLQLFAGSAKKAGSGAVAAASDAGAASAAAAPASAAASAAAAAAPAEGGRKRKRKGAKA